jgi:hypothetical protein
MICPALRNTTSPGTSSVAGILTKSPSRRQEKWLRMFDRSASTEDCAFSSCSNKLFNREPRGHSSATEWLSIIFFQSIFDARPEHKVSNTRGLLEAESHYVRLDKHLFGMYLMEADRGIDEEHREDDAEVVPFAGHRRQHNRHLYGQSVVLNNRSGRATLWCTRLQGFLALH